MCSYQDGWFDSFVWAEGRKNKLCPSLHMKPISIYYACTSFWAWYSGLWSQWQLWHWLQCAHPRRATSIISYSLVEVFFGHKLPISTQVTVSQKLFFFLPLSGLFLSFLCFFHGFQIFLLHVCMQVHKVYMNCFYADRSGVKRGRPLSSDTFQMSDCNTSSLKWPFIGALLDS